MAPGAFLLLRSDRSGLLTVPIGPNRAQKEVPKRHDQADLSAQEATSRSRTRLSRAHEHEGRSACHRSAASKGAQEADRLNRSETSPMSGSLEMLRSPLDFRAMQSDSRSRVHPLLVLRYRRNELDRTRYGISTGRRLGSAVVRNRVRRRLKTILHRLNGRLARGWDVLLVVRPAAAEASQAELGRALEKLLNRSGLMEGTGSAT